MASLTNQAAISNRLISCSLNRSELPARRKELDPDWLQLQNDQPALNQLTKELTKRQLNNQTINELHLIAHGNNEGFELAGQWIDRAKILHHASELHQWNINTLVLWCCEVGHNQELILLLENLTGAEVFSTPDTLNKSRLSTKNRNGKTHHLLELFDGNTIEYWQGNLAWIQVDDEIEGRKKGARNGESVSLSSDGSTLAIGSWNDRTHKKQQGSVATYKLNSDNEWEQIAVIDGDHKGDRFGSSVSLSNDGTRLAVGAPRDDNGGTNSGTISIYELSGSTWNKLGQTIAGLSNGRAGAALELSGDGNTVIFGSVKKYSNKGFAGIYTWDGTSWNQVGSNILGIGKEHSGSSVSISKDGNRIAIGSPRFNSFGINKGRVRVYDKVNNSWSLKFSITGEAAEDRSGSSISLSDDGNILAIGAWGNNGSGNNSSHVRVYDISGTEKVKLGSDIDGAKGGDRFGGSISLSSNGKRLAVGAEFGDGAAKDSGIVNIYEYQNSNDTWTQVGSSLEGEAAGDRATHSVGNSGVSLSGDGQSVAVGAQWHDGTAGTNSGHTRIFTASGITIAQTGTTDGSGNLLTTEAGSTSTFTVVLDAQPTANVTVTLSGADSTEHSLSSSSLTFTTSNWNTAQTVTVTGVDDSLDDGDITTTLTATASNTGGYAGTETATTTLKTSDNDAAGITIAQTGTTDGSGNLLTTGSRLHINFHCRS